MGFKEEFLKIDKTNLNKSMQDLPAIIYDFGVKQANLEATVTKMELELEISESKIAAGLRTKYKNVPKSRQPSETQIRDQVRSHPEIIEKKTTLIDKRKLLKLAKLKLKTLGVKTDMVTNISHNVREERKSSKKIRS